MECGAKEHLYIYVKQDNRVASIGGNNLQPINIYNVNAQSRHMRSMIYQNRLALDCILAEGGGVCGKFNSSECCVETDDHSEVQ